MGRPRGPTRNHDIPTAANPNHAGPGCEVRGGGKLGAEKVKHPPPHRQQASTGVRPPCLRHPPAASEAS
eukprot:614593-Alexandrium_andersonii.AAC.1